MIRSPDSPLHLHRASPAELRDRLRAEQSAGAFLLFRDDHDVQHIHQLGDEARHATVGRAAGSDVWLAWDDEVSRLHAELERVGPDWVCADDGLSANGTYCNGERVRGRRRLADGDELRFGQTVVAFRRPVPGDGRSTLLAPERSPVDLSNLQRQVLVALCRPFAAGEAGLPVPATNPEIAHEVHLSVDAVKGHLRTLFARFEVGNLPQNAKRMRLVELALQRGVVGTGDFGR